jgi:hypothetical protein
LMAVGLWSGYDAAALRRKAAAWYEVLRHAMEMGRRRT